MITEDEKKQAIAHTRAALASVRMAQHHTGSWMTLTNGYLLQSEQALERAIKELKEAK